jgi:hypothetical protein
MKTIIFLVTFFFSLVAFSNRRPCNYTVNPGEDREAACKKVPGCDWFPDHGCYAGSYKCFAADSFVTRENGTRATLNDLKVDERIVDDLDGRAGEVQVFTDKKSGIMTELIEVKTEHGHDLQLTGNHYLYVNGRLRTADDLFQDFKFKNQRFFWLETISASRDRLVSVEKIERYVGLVNFFTDHPERQLIVNGIKVSHWARETIKRKNLIGLISIVPKFIRSKTQNESELSEMKDTVDGIYDLYDYLNDIISISKSYATDHQNKNN